MLDNVQWLIRSSQKDTESQAFSNLPIKIGEEPDWYSAMDANRFSISFFQNLPISPTRRHCVLRLGRKYLDASYCQVGAPLFGQEEIARLQHFNNNQRVHSKL